MTNWMWTITKSIEWPPGSGKAQEQTIIMAAPTCTEVLSNYLRTTDTNPDTIVKVERNRVLMDTTG